MKLSKYNQTMSLYDPLGDPLMDILSAPRVQQWTGAQITSFLSDIQRQYEVASRLNISEAQHHYRDLLSQLIKTYGH